MNHDSTRIASAPSWTARRFLVLVALCMLAACTPNARGDDEPAQRKLTFHVTGLFNPERERDLRDLFDKQTRFKLLGIDCENAEVTVEFDPAKVWPNEKPGRFVELFDNELRSGSRGTFGAKRPPALAADKLKRVEVPVQGLDCQGCCLAAYRMIYQLPGVEIATVSFKSGQVIALVDPDKIDRSRLEAALKKGGVEIVVPAK